MTVGFTGTLAGMSPPQKERLRWLLTVLRGVTVLHHGLCPDGRQVADREAKEIAESLHISTEAHVIEKEDKSPLDRDRRIVIVSDILIAAPLTDKEVLRSGTWATVRYARLALKPVVMLARGGVSPRADLFADLKRKGGQR